MKAKSERKKAKGTKEEFLLFLFFLVKAVGSYDFEVISQSYKSSIHYPIRLSIQSFDGSPDFVVINKPHILTRPGITESRTVVLDTIYTINPGEPF
jgi:hypothetical protein